MLHVEYDISEYETLRIIGPQGIQLEEKYKTYTLNVSLKEVNSALIDSVSVTFYRGIKASEMDTWEAKRNTGLRLSWHFKYSSYEEAKNYYHHSAYVFMANIIHQGHRLKRLWKNVKFSRNLLFLNKTSDDFPSCGRGKTGGMLHNKYIISLSKDVKKNYENVSFDAPYPTIKNETLREAARIYFYLIHCPENVEKSLDMKTFYDDLIQKQSLTTILLTLGILKGISVVN